MQSRSDMVRSRLLSPMLPQPGVLKERENFNDVHAANKADGTVRLSVFDVQSHNLKHKPESATSCDINGNPSVGLSQGPAHQCEWQLLNRHSHTTLPAHSGVPLQPCFRNFVLPSHAKHPGVNDGGREPRLSML